MRGLTFLLLAGFVMLNAQTAMAGTLLQAQYGTLHLGLKNLNEQQSCHVKNLCEDLQGISIRDHDVTLALSLAPPGANVRFYLVDAGDSRGAGLSQWEVCLHTASGFLLRCYENGSYGVAGTIPRETVSMRVILNFGIERPYEIRIGY